MGEERKQKRVDAALLSLVHSLIRSTHDEDNVLANERHARALELAKGIIHDPIYTIEAPEINNASDLIKKKLLRENVSPDKAVRFSSLYSKLLAQPVLAHKWAILYFLHRLAGLDEESEEYLDHMASQPAPRSATSQNDSSGRALNLSSQKLDASWSGRTGDFRTEDTIASTLGNSSIKGQTGNPSELTLLRDLPFTLQGVSSTNLVFDSSSTVTLPSKLPLPLISLLHTLAEPSLLYRSLADFVGSQGEGLVGQSLRAAVNTELRSYLGLIATLEAEIRRSIASLGENKTKRGIVNTGVTLKRCVIWTREATMGLRLMSLMAEESKIRRGGQIISMIHSFSSSHGDPFVSAFAERILSHVTRPFYDMLQQWIYDGELLDPYQEFFVIEKSDRLSGDREADPRIAAAPSVWEDKYKLDDNMIPSIITEDFAKKIFLIGKSLNFIRHSCGDSAWVETHSKDASKELRYGDTATLEVSIDRAYKATMARLIHLMDDKFRLFEHLGALKRFLLLGQGDFVALLMESLSSNLDRPAGSQYRHTLTAQLEHAIRGSNAQYDSPDVLRRLDARLVELSHGEIGWDVFTLEYKVDAPVDVVITPWASKQYLVVFNFLWRVKRVEFALGSTWRRCMTGARGVLASVNDQLGRDWKVARCCIAEMIHFVNQLQYYILFEVIEASWDQLQAAITEPECTLDDVIGAHTTYIKAITHKGLLGSAKINNTGHREDSFTGQLHQILKIMLAYRDAVDGLYSFSVAEFTRRQEQHAKLESRTTQGKRGMVGKDDTGFESPNPRRKVPGLDSRDTDSSFPATGDNGDEHMLPAIRNRLRDLSVDFRSRLNVLLGDLAYQPDIDMRFLGVVMNFNDVYNPKRRRREHHRSGDKDKRTPADLERGLQNGAEGRTGAKETRAPNHTDSNSVQG